MGKRILVLSAAVGAGHLRAAEAVEKALRGLDPRASVKTVDMLTLTNALYRRVYAKAYLDLVNRAPHLLGYFYDKTDKAGPRDGTADRLQQLIDRINVRGFTDLLSSEPWDVVVNTHFLSAGLLARLRRKKRTAQRHVTVVTDFDAHAFWDNQPCDRYYVATEETRQTLGSRGIPEADIRVTGIPIDPVFAEQKDRASLLKKHGLRGDRPIVLMLAGGFGVGPIEKLLAGLLRAETGLEVIAVAGRNAALKQKLERTPVPRHHCLHVLGFTREMDELLVVADAVVTKPGGLTTSEALARGVAMVIVNPIPGQEARNSDYLLENGAAIKINSLGAMAYKVEALLGDSARLRQLRNRAKSLGRPRSALEVAADVLRLAGTG
ncbi:MAG: glycosyltransferase [Phycisphaerales bacterium]